LVALLRQGGNVDARSAFGLGIAAFARRQSARSAPGRWVFHCHILQHEDLGMMGKVRAFA
jgi:hypothetical protein